MNYIIPSIIIAAGLIGMAIIVSRKFAQLANLDVESLPEEIEARKKKEIISRRVEAEGQKVMNSMLRKMQPFRKLWGQLQLKFRIYVGKIERLFHHEQRSKTAAPVQEVPQEMVENKLSSYVNDGNYFLQQGDLDKAEELFLAAIKVDVKHAPAYRGLADTYLAKGALEEAKETYEFLLQLQPSDDMAMTKLAELYEKKGEIENAITYLQQAVVLNDSLSSRFYHLTELLLKVGQPEVAREAILQAVELEPKNPKYLDLLIETGILCGDKDLAKRGFHELRLVNPENQKLESFQGRINVLT